MDNQPTDHLAGFAITLRLPVLWGDQDAFRHVNNTIYLRWFESARIAYFDAIGLGELMARERIGAILASVTCHFRRPVTYPDTIRTGTRISRIGRTSMAMEHVVVVESSNEVVADGTGTTVVFDYTVNRPHPVPEAVRSAIELLEGRRFS